MEYGRIWTSRVLYSLSTALYSFLDICRNYIHSNYFAATRGVSARYMSKLHTFLLFYCDSRSLRCAALSRLNPVRRTTYPKKTTLKIPPSKAWSVRSSFNTDWRSFVTRRDSLMPSSNGLCALRKFVERNRISLERLLSGGTLKEKWACFLRWDLKGEMSVFSLHRSL